MKYLALCAALLTSCAHHSVPAGGEVAVQPELNLFYRRLIALYHRAVEETDNITATCWVRQSYETRHGSFVLYATPEQVTLNAIEVHSPTERQNRRDLERLLSKLRSRWCRGQNIWGSSPLVLLTEEQAYTYLALDEQTIDDFSLLAIQGYQQQGRVYPSRALQQMVDDAQSLVPRRTIISLMNTSR